MLARILAAAMLLAGHGALAQSTLAQSTFAQSTFARSTLGRGAVPDGELCLRAIGVAEQRAGLPPKLLGAVAVSESGRPDPVTQRTVPWPWTINADGTGHFYATKAEAVAAVQDFVAAGAQSIDVGCMQINLHYHPAAFASLDEAFDPAANAGYGAGFLRALFRSLGDWSQAVAAYHSQTAGIGEPYRDRVMTAWSFMGGSGMGGSGMGGSGMGGSGMGGSGADVLAGLGSRPVSNGYDRYTPHFAALARSMQEEKLRLVMSRTRPP